jgi:16S rRNA (uracil1498-N3)-methyltransferase
MRKFFINDEVKLNDSKIIISGETAHHILHVLRIKSDEELTFGDQQATDYIGVFESSNKKSDTLVFSVTGQHASDMELPYRVTLYQAVPQASGVMETIIQKSVESGVYRIVPVITARSASEHKAADVRLKRYQRVADMAAGQSRRTIIPVVSMFTSIKEVIENKPLEQRWLAAYENEKTVSIRDAVRDTALSDIGIWIGPEGGFNAAELDLLTASGAVKVTLGRRILRTETAGLTALVHLQCALGAEKL